MVIRAAGDEAEAGLLQHLCQRLRVGDNLRGIGVRIAVEPLVEADRLGRDDILQGTALNAREDRLVDGADVLLLAEDEARARPAQGLVRGGGHEVGIGHRRGMDTAGDEAGDVGHIHHQVGAHLVGNRPEAGKVNHARIGRSARQNELGLDLHRLGLDGVVVELLGLLVHHVGDNVVELAREVHRRAVAQVAALVQTHREDRVAGLEHCEEDGHIRRAAAVRLDIRRLGPEELLGALDGQRFHRVHRQAAAVPALARIALGILVVQHRALRLAHGGGGVVLRGNQVDRFVLLLDLRDDGRVDLGIGPSQEGGLGQTAGAVALHQAPGVTFGPREGRLQPHLQRALGRIVAQRAGRKDEDIGIIVLARELGHRLIGDNRRADAGETVGGDAHPNPGRAQQHATVGLLFQHSLADRHREVRIVIGGLGVE